jgi:hypothetical protein
VHRMLFCVAGSLATLIAAHSASATILNVTFHGIVSSGFDGSGEFGVAGSSLTGDRYTTTYRFDDSEGVRTTLPPYLDQVIGGPFDGHTDPSLGATLTINGHAISFNGADLGLEENYPLGGSVSSYAADLAPPGQFDAGFIGNSLAAPGVPASLDTAFSAGGTPGVNGFINGFQIANGPGKYEVAFATGFFSPESVAVSVESSVPEPTAWALMIAGFGILGVGRRLSRQSYEPLAV